MFRPVRSIDARALSLLIVVGSVQCTAVGFRSRPGVAELRGAHYSDNSGLAVATLGADVAQPLTPEVTATLRGVADHVVVDRTVVDVPPAIAGNTLTGHQDHASTEADVVTSASSAVVGGVGSDKWRFEAAPGVRWDAPASETTSSVGAEARVSSEPDYLSLTGLVRAQTSFFEDNTTLSGFAGYGRDRVMPPVAPPGQGDQWPATHTRVLGGVSLSQLVSPALRVFAGGSFTLQRGTLSNPYRRAAVRTSLFPEVLPRERNRFTGALGAALFVGWDAAVHARLGGYVDDWGVRAVIPEGAVTKTFGENLLLDLHYRYYAQAAADFYAPVYSDLASVLAGDMRLGRLHDQTFGANLQWLALGRRDDFGSLVLSARLDLSVLEYDQLATDSIFAKVIQVGLRGTY